MGLNLTIRRAVVIAILLGVLVPALIVGAYFTRVFYYNKLDREIVRTLQHNSDVLALGVRESLWAIDSESASALAEAIMKDSPLVSVEILDSQLGRFVFHEAPERRLGKIHTLDRAVLHRGEAIGRIKLELSDEILTTEFRQQLISQVSALALQLLFSTLLILAVLQHWVGIPLKRLSREAESLAKGDLNAVITPLRKDEIGEVESQLEVTRHALQGLFHALEQKNRTLEVDLRERMRVEAALRDREQRLRTLVDQSPLAVIEFDLEWHILDWNDAAVAVYGWHKEEVLGRSAQLLMATPRDLTKPPSLLATQEKQFNKRSDDSKIACQWYNGIIRDSSGSALRIVSMIEDITERQHADDEIRRLATVVRMTTNLVSLVDTTGKILWFNRAFGERCTSLGTDLIGNSLVSILAGNRTAVTETGFDSIINALDSGEGQSVSELQCTSSTGATYWVSVDLQPIRDEYGILSQWVVVMTDITQRHNVSESLRNIARISATHDTRSFLEQIQTAVARGSGASGSYIALHQRDLVDVCSTWGTSVSCIRTGTYPIENSLAALIESSGAQVIAKSDTQFVESEYSTYDLIVAEPIFDPQHALVGHLSLLFSTPPQNIEEIQSMAQIGASRAGVELSRQHTLDALKHSEQRFSSIFQNAPIPLALFRCIDGYCLDLNPAFRDTFSNFGQISDSENPPGGKDYQSWLRTVLADNLEKSTADLRMLTAEGDLKDCQLIARSVSINEEASQLVAIVDVTLLLDAQRQIKELNLSLESRVRDRTHDLAEANSELEKTLERLKQTLDELVRSEKLAALGSLVAGIAHELNTPIGNSLIVASTLRDFNREFREQIRAGLRKSTLDSYVQENDSAADILVRNLQRAAELITSFKQVAVDQTSSQRRVFDLAEVINEIVVTMHPVFRKTSHSIDIRIPDDLSLDSYPGPLGQIIANLLNNALLHAFEGRDNGLVTLAADMPDPEHVCLSCHDNGNGISPANLKRIFDPFFTTKLGQDGTGLGLNIVHNIVTGILGGTIQVESTEQKGTVFMITIPLKAPGA